jgi:iron(III) transport system substrate-binding protein
MRRIGRLAIAALGLIAVAASGAACAADAALIAAAQKEGEVVWYTTQILDPLVLRFRDAFQKAYGIEIKPVRSNSTEIALRVLNEGRAGKVQADIYDGTTTAEALKSERLAMRWLPPNAKDLPAEYVDPDGYWVATNYYLITAAYNTDLIPPGKEPRTFEDLLAPHLRGQIVWGNTVSISAGAGFIGLVLKEMGEEKGMAYLRQLAGQKIAGVQAAARVVIDQAIAGEYAVALQIFPEHATGSAAKGAPIRWIPMQPAMSAVVSTTGITQGAPHPNAAKLLLEYMISPEGQAIFRDAFYSPANPAVPPKDPDFRPGRYRTVFLTPAEAVNALPRWMQIFKDLF